MKSIIDALRTNHSEILILPPAGANVPSSFQYVTVDPHLYREVLADMQRFRGEVYLADGALHPDELSDDGRHDLPIDRDSWHVVTVDACGRVAACLRFLEERVASGFDSLWLKHSAITRCPRWGAKVRVAVEKEMAAAGKQKLRFGEVGGWAISPDRRCTIEALRTILATYGLLQVLGGCVGVATATRRHGSAPILRKIGLSPLDVDGQTIPSYYDPQYRCEMEILRYDSRSPNAKYIGWVAELASFLLNVPVICSSRFGPSEAALASRPQPATLWAPSPVAVSLT